MAEQLSLLSVANFLGLSLAEVKMLKEKSELGTDEAAVLLACSAQTVREFVESGDLSAFVYKRRGAKRSIYRFSKSAVLAFKAKMKRTGWDELQDELKAKGKAVLGQFAKREPFSSSKFDL